MENIIFIDIDDIQKVIKKDTDTSSSDIKIVPKIGMIEKCSFINGFHMLVRVGDEKIWLEGPIESFDGKKEDYKVGNVIEIKAKRIGTITCNCEFGNIENIPIYVADWVSLL